MQDDERTQALLNEAAELDRQLVDYVVTRLAAERLDSDLSVSQAIEGKVSSAVERAVAPQIAPLSAMLADLRRELQQATERLSQVNTAPAAAAPPPPPPSPLLDEAPPPEPVRVKPSAPAEPVGVVDRVRRSGLLASAVAMLAVVIAGGSLWMMRGAQAEAARVCAAARASAEKLDLLLPGLNDIASAEGFDKLLKTARPEEPAEAGDTASDVPLPARMADAIDMQRSGIERQRDALAGACGGASTGPATTAPATTQPG